MKKLYALSLTVFLFLVGLNSQNSNAQSFCASDSSGQVITTLPISSSENQIITDLDVYVYIVGDGFEIGTSFAGVTLISPLGTTISVGGSNTSAGLCTGGSGSFALVNTFDDEATNLFPSCGGTSQPIGSLSDFDGENFAGTWQVKIANNAIRQGLDGDLIYIQVCLIPDFGSVAVDADNDGYTDDVDCDDNDAAINPGAPEICDGIDNNCDGNIDQDDSNLVDTDAPELTCPTPEESYAVDAGSCSASLTFDATSFDNCGVASVVYSVNGNVITFPNAFLVGTTTVDVLVTDVNDNTSSCSFDVVVANSAPENIVVTGQSTPQEIGSSVDASATFSDENIASATWIAFDGNSEVQSETISITGTTTNYTFVSLPVGVYTIILKLTDHCGEETIEQWQYAVIYDPNGGFVTGGGWIHSEEGALVGSDAEGKANFGFVAKYKTGNNTNNEVDGNTSFKFKSGDFNFKSASHEDMSLVISGERKATYKGIGTVNGSGSYGFMVTVVDGEAPGAGLGDIDTFRIKVWDGSPSNVIYDNEMGSSENTDAVTGLEGGSIVIHKPKGNSKARSDEGLNAIGEDTFEGIELLTWPNPSDDYFNLKLKSSNTNDNITINVYDLHGRLVMNKTHAPNKVHTVGGTLRAGLYFVTVSQGNEIETVKLLKN